MNEATITKAGHIAWAILAAIALIGMLCTNSNADTPKNAREWTGIVVHHSASPLSTTIRDIRKWHVEENGWSDVGYHFVIESDGTVRAGRPLDRIGAHARGRNATHIGICLVGYDKFTDAQLKSLRGGINILCKRFSIRIVEGHHEECPGPGVSILDLLRIVDKYLIK
jgi:N-acetylmuramoyl-L-alanine amidase